MLVTEPLNPFIPIVSGEINGKKQNIAFDTGANFLVMSKAAAESMGISYDSSLFFTGKQGYSTSKMWVGVVDNLVLGKDVKLKNVPVTIMEEMNTEIIIFGTSILKEFYTTIDYPNNQFVFTTKDKPELVKAHQKRYAGNEMNFIMWSDHYMMGKGSYNDKRINMFFDSGLVVVGQANGVIAQSWLCLSKESMENLGIEEKENTSTRAVTATNDILTIAGMDNENVILSLSGSGDFSFGGIMCDLLVSHGVIKNYAWTIDFENMKYMFK
jgi:predicted aspartyl protease